MKLENYSKHLTLLTLLIFAGYLVLGGYFLQQEKSLDVEIDVVNGSGVKKFSKYSSLTVEITNREEKPIKPVITVLMNSEKRNFLWDQNTSWLQPGETRNFTIESTGYMVSIPRGEDFQVLVNNHSEASYRYSQVYNFDLDKQVIFNPELYRFPSRHRVPMWRGRTIGEGSIERRNNSILLKSRKGRSMIFQYTDMPKSITFRAEIPEGNKAKSGVQLDTLKREVNMIFSDVSEKKYLEEKILLPKNQDSWTIDIEQFYRKRNWSMNPGISVRSRRGSYPAQLIFFLETKDAPAEAELYYFDARFN